MQSKAATVEQYLAELPEDRRATVQAVRSVILKNLPQGYEEGMQYGMIGYYVPHSLYAPGYHCDPKQPLPFAALASQKITFRFIWDASTAIRTTKPGSARLGPRAVRSWTWENRACGSRNSKTCR